MAKKTVGTTPVKIASAGQCPSVQNLGGGALYLDTRSDVAVGTGLKLVVDGIYEFPRDLTKDLYAVADAAGTDVRILMVG